MNVAPSIVWRYALSIGEQHQSARRYDGSSADCPQGRLSEDTPRHAAGNRIHAVWCVRFKFRLTDRLK